MLEAGAIVREHTMDIDKMEACEGLDQFVAVEVMGWRLTADGRSAISPYGGKWDASRHWCPLYSSKIESAWEIVNKLGKQGWFTRLFQYKNELVSCQFERPDRNMELAKVVWSAVAETAPLAICKAAARLVQPQ